MSGADYGYYDELYRREAEEKRKQRAHDDAILALRTRAEAAEAAQVERCAEAEAAGKRAEAAEARVRELEDKLAEVVEDVRQFLDIHERGPERDAEARLAELVRVPNEDALAVARELVDEHDGPVEHPDELAEDIAAALQVWMDAASSRERSSAEGWRKYRETKASLRELVREVREWEYDETPDGEPSLLAILDKYEVKP